MLCVSERERVYFPSNTLVPLSPPISIGSTNMPTYFFPSSLSSRVHTEPLAAAT